MNKKIFFSIFNVLLCMLIAFSFSASAERVDKDSPLPNGSKESSKESSSKSSSTKRTINNRAKVTKYKGVNADTVAWLYVPGTNIDEVVVGDPNSHNLYYGSRDFYGNYDYNGTTFSDYRSTFGSGLRSELARNTVIYGHTRKENPNGVLFEQLKRFKNEDFAKNTPYIILSTEKDNIVWEVFAVFDAHVNFPYILSNPPKSYTVSQLIKATQKSSIYNYNVSVDSKDKILTLSTCTFSVAGHEKLPFINDYRFAIAARMVPAGTKLKSKASFTINPSPHPPDTYNFIP